MAETTNTTPVAENAAPQKLTKSDIRKSFWLWQLFSHANYNYERMQGGAFAMCMAPLLKKLYPKKEDLIQGLQRHLVFFNTNPNVGTVIHGAVIAMEEERAAGADISDDAINSVKTGLMGPLAGIGDALDQGVIIPLMVALGISIGATGNLFGPILVLFGLPMCLVPIAYNSWMQGYRLGGKAFGAMLSGGRMKQLMDAAGILGCTVMGGLIPNFVNVSTKISFNIGAEAFDLQTQLFDAIMPNMLPLAVTLGTFALITFKKVNTLVVLAGMVVIGFITAYLGIL